MESPRTLLESVGSSLSAPWGGTSNIADLDGDVHWVDFGGPADATPIVLVHGLGGSHLNWVQVAPLLAQHTRVYALDLAGFGLTQANGRHTGIPANTALLNAFIDTVVGRPVILFGNSMGGMVSALATHARPDSVAGLVLVDPALPLPIRIPDPVVAAQFLVYSLPYLGEQALRLGRRAMTDQELSEQMTNLCFSDPTRADTEVLAAGAALSTIRRNFPGQDSEFLQAARSLLTTLARPREYRKALRNITVPTLLIHGERDRLVSVAAAHCAAASHPHWTTIILGDTGHTPQLEVPDEFNRHALAWLSHTDLIKN
ncbi:alpha/beta fold hydrolase [Rhodococcus sp. OK302]|uniref:alpha/beta fold hydrolase n=1 Tax=Rhodococcus sp. OK302 TaxID=1882769 RepID=UPI000B93EB99|nr:alpha/beta hydrolase [Rhodococcus sp. OK302]OYD66539.1 pimeloyl-ACP methyl ester carboxylesterase [Rhodococcus sp. OK302]